VPLRKGQAYTTFAKKLIFVRFMVQAQEIIFDQRGIIDQNIDTYFL
jgi:hypothetical protein